MCKTIDHCLFRELYHRYVLFHQDPAEAGLARMGFPCGIGDNAFLAYGYVDHTAGLSFEVLAAARVTPEGLLALQPGRPEGSLKLRYGSVKAKVQCLGKLIPNESFFPKIRMVRQAYRTSDVVEKLRELEAIDFLRHPQFPDDILVAVSREGYRREGMWCRLEGVQGKELLGVLLDDPFQIPGVHRGDMIRIRLMAEHGKIAAAAEL